MDRVKVGRPEYGKGESLALFALDAGKFLFNVTTHLMLLASEV